MNITFMQRALTLAERNIGQTWPNPSVGCVLVEAATQKICAEGITQVKGRPHAETMALAQLQNKRPVSEVDAYISLEPCAHQGQTLPCVKHLVEAGIKRVIVALQDSDPRTSGRGISYLREHGVKVEVGLCETEAYLLNKGFFLRFSENRPFVTLKWASSIDGKIAEQNGNSQWITESTARHHVHLMRYKHDAIMVGVSTIIQDNPKLNCRISGCEDTPLLRVIIDPDLRIPLNARILPPFKNTKTLIITSNHDLEKWRNLEDIGVSLTLLQKAPYQAQEILVKLVNFGVTRVFCEGGAKLNSLFLREHCFDEIMHYQGRKIIGGLGVAAIDEIYHYNLHQPSQLQLKEIIPLDQDVCHIYERVS